MASKPTQRSLAHLRKHGWSVCIVEKFLPKRPGMKFPRRIDAFGFGDLLACRPPFMVNGVPTVPGRIALIQTTAGAGGAMAAHRRKILAIPEFQKWKDAGGLVFLHGWVKRTRRGEREYYELREEIL